MKGFPTEGLIHTHLTCIINIVKENDIRYDDIKDVQVTTIARACDILFDSHKYRPESRETADHSLPYCLAAAIVDRQITTQSFSDEKLKDERIWAVIDKIKGVASTEFEKMFPAKQPSRVVVTTNDGKFYEDYREYPKGDPREPMTEDDLDVKFGGLAEELLDEPRRASVKNMIFNCENFTAADFMEKLVV